MNVNQGKMAVLLISETSIMHNYRILYLGTLLFFFIGLHGSIAQESAFAADHLRSFKDGKTLYAIGTYAAAQEQLYVFLNSTENFSTPEYDRLHMEAEFLIAESALRLNQSNAERLLLSFIRKYKPDPYAIKAISKIADYYYNARDYEKAVKYYREIDLYALPEEKRTEIHFKIGYCELVQKDFAQARSQFQLIKDIKGPYYYPANYYLAMSQYFTDNYDKALHGFYLVQQSRKYRDVTPYYITHIYFLQGKYKELIPFAEAAIQKSGTRYRTEIKYLLGQAYFKQGDYKKALPLLKEQASRSTRPEDIYQLAFSYYKNGKYKEAARYFKKVSAQEGKMGQNANFYLADTYIELGNKADARVAFANASRKNYDEKIAEEALFNYGKISAELQYDREAVNALKDIPPSSSFYRSSQKVLSDVFYDTRDYAHSIEIMEDMGSLSPDLKKAYQRITLNYGLQKLNDGDEKAALKYFDKSLKYPINTSEKLQVHYWKAYIFNTQAQYDKSIGELNTYFTLLRSGENNLPHQSSEALARYLQGYNYFKQKKYRMASGQFGRTISLIRLENPGSAEYLQKKIEPDALVRQGDCFFKANDYDQAIERYNQALNIGYKSPGYALYQKAIILGLQEKVAKKILYLNKIADDYPSSAFADDALLEIGRTFQVIQKYDQAIPPLRKLVSKYKGKSNLVNTALLSLGLIAYNQGDVKAALRYYKEVIDNNPDKQTTDEALYAIREIYVQDLGEPGEYVTYLEDVRGTELKATTRDSLTFRSANLAFESGNYDKAISNLTEYIQEFPKGLYKTKAHYFRAESFAVQQKYKKALSDYEFVAAQGPGNYYFSALEKAAKIAYNSTHEFKKAVRYYNILSENARTEDKRFEAMIGSMEAAYRGENNNVVKQKALQVSSSPLATESDIAKAQFYLAKVAMKESKYDDALNAFNQVMQYTDDEKAAEARYSIARIYYLRQEYDLARDLAEKAYKESTAYPYWIAKSLLLLSDVLVIQDDLFNARAAVEAIIENFKADKEILKEAKTKLAHIKDLQKKEQESSDGLLQMEEN